ncbi:MAG: hypothetical protein JW730_18265 [Anaerolineales bacterium]|nr:hypothetical protein [Anaerolineales bacterium]
MWPSRAGAGSGVTINTRLHTMYVSPGAASDRALARGDEGFPWRPRRPDELTPDSGSYSHRGRCLRALQPEPGGQ